ncbi:MAG TPA: carboxypeptidase-like regulatory domain-containing protein [Candidatus Acidoferrales bacterium]
MLARRIGALGLVAAALLLAAPALAGPNDGRLTGIVVDPKGTPQMGATVWILAEDSLGTSAKQLLTNEKGVFAADRLTTGLYSVRVTLAGFLPALERHVRIEANLSTILKIELDSLFTSFDRLRRPNRPQKDDEWAWVLRTTSGTRPVLRYSDGEVVLASDRTQVETSSPTGHPRGQLEVSTGARRPGSAGNLADSPSTSFAFEQVLTHTSRLLLAGQVSYEDSGTAGFSATWLPAGDNGPRSTVVLRQVNMTSADRLRTLRMDHETSVTLGDRVELRYGAEYVMVSLDRSRAALLPRGELTYLISPAWRATLSLTANSSRSGAAPASALQAALETLDSFPAVMMRDGRPVLDTGRHSEAGIEHLMGPNARLMAAVFHDQSNHTSVFGRGRSGGDFFHDAFFNGFSYDGGGSSSWGTRMAYQRKIGTETEITAVYSFAGALVADDVTEDSADLRSGLTTANRHSLGTRVSTRLPRFGTRVAASYKWISGPIVSRHDAAGENAFQLDPYLTLQVRQPLPGMLFSGRLEAVADFRNLLAQGYVPVSLRDGSIVLMPTFRSFRGGLSFQF